MTRKLLLALIAGLLSPAFALATTIVLHGTVTSWPSGDPIEDARVMLWDVATSCGCECCEGAPLAEAFTDEQGRYLIIVDDLPPGARYRLATESGTPCQSFRQRLWEGAPREQIARRVDFVIPEMCLPRFCC